MSLKFFFRILILRLQACFTIPSTITMEAGFRTSLSPSHLFSSSCLYFSSIESRLSFEDCERGGNLSSSRFDSFRRRNVPCWGHLGGLSLAESFCRLIFCTLVTCLVQGIHLSMITVEERVSGSSFSDLSWRICVYVFSLDMPTLYSSSGHFFPIKSGLDKSQSPNWKIGTSVGTISL